MEAKNSYPGVAIVAALVCIGFVIFVFVYDDLKTNPFVQGITGLLVALAIAIILFSAVPGSFATVKLPIGLAGAAAFYWLLLPRIEPYVFPLRTVTFAGYIFYETKDSSGSIPVEGADVEIAQTGLKAKTDASGKFVIPDVPSHLDISNLMVTRGGRVHQINVKTTPGRIYNIPREPQTLQSDKQRVPNEAWFEDAGGLCPSDRKEFASAKQFSLRTNVPILAGYSDLLVEVQSADEMKILKARKSEPTVGNRIETDNESKTQRWGVPVKSEPVSLAISVCVGTLKKGVGIQKAGLQAFYWFEKAE